MTPYQEHKHKWLTCSDCDLCTTRQKVVLFRGKIPCDALFIGEAPGASENVLGRPFVGPAGKLLDHIVNDATQHLPPLRIGFTNLVACLPTEGGKKAIEPPKESIEACADRLRELLAIARPQAIICVGSYSTKWAPKLLNVESVNVTSIVHPAAILRMDVSQKGLAVQRATVVLHDALEEVCDVEAI